MVEVVRTIFAFQFFRKIQILTLC